MSLELSDDRVAEICRVLLEYSVLFVVIGGVAARLHGTGHATIDIDVCPATDDENLDRLAKALRQLDARLRVEGEPDGIPFDPHPASLRQVTTMTLITQTARSICASSQPDSPTVTKPSTATRSRSTSPPSRCR